MIPFATWLSTCRIHADPKVTQTEIGALLGRHPTTITKWESKLISQRRQVAPPTPAEIQLLKTLFRDRNVFEEEIESLDLTSDKTWGVGPTGKTEYLIRDLVERLEQLPLLLGDAARSDLSIAVNVYQRTQQTMDEFAQGKLTFAESESKHSAILEAGNKILGLADALNYLHRAKSRRFRAEIDNALADFAESYTIAKTLPRNYYAFRRMIAIEYGDCLSRLDGSYYAEALDLYEEAKSLEPEHPQAERRIARIHLFAGEPRVAIEHCEISLELAKNSGNKEEERKTLEHQAWSYSLLGRLDEALAAQRKAHSMAEAMDQDDKDLAKSHRYLGDYQLLCEDFRLAQENFGKADAYIAQSRQKMKGSKEDEEQEKLLRGPLLLGLATSYLSNPRKISEAEGLLGTSLDISVSLQDSATKGLVYMRFGQIAFGRRLWAQAQQYYAKALETFQMAGRTLIGENEYCNPYYIADLRLQEASLAFANNRIDAALDHFNDALTLSQNFGYGLFEVKAMLGLEAIALQHQTNPINDSINSLEVIVQRGMAISPILAKLALRYIQTLVATVATIDKGKSNIISQAILDRWPKHEWYETAKQKWPDTLIALTSQLNQLITIWETSSKENRKDIPKNVARNRSSKLK